MKTLIRMTLVSFSFLFLVACQLDDASVPASTQVLEAVIRSSVRQGNAPLTIAFDASASRGASNFSWDFGDGFTATGVFVEHSYSQAGTFTVQLTASARVNGVFRQSLASLLISVEEANRPNPQPNPVPDPNPVPNPDSGTTIAAASGLVLSLKRAELERELAVLGVDAVAFASQQNTLANAPVLFGTLNQAADGTFSYSNVPSDRLRLVFSDASFLEYRFTAFAGDFNQPTGERFLRKDHHISFKLVTSEGSNVNIALLQTTGNYQNTVQGTLMHEGRAFQLDTQTQGRVLSDINPPGLNFQTEEATLGTISAADFRLELNETFRYQLVIFDDAVEDIRHSFDNRWVIANQQFQLSNGVIRRILKNAKPVELDNWAAQGVLSRNAQVIGSLGLEQTAFSVDTVLSSDAEKVILFSDKSF